MFKKLKAYVLFQQRQWRRAKWAKRSQFSNPVINQISQKVDDQFQYQKKVNQEFLKQLQSLNQPKITPPKQPTPKRVVKPKVVKAKVHRPKPLPKGPKTNWQKEWDRGMRLNRKFIDINVARELALAKDRKIANLEKELKQERQERRITNQRLAKMEKQIQEMAKLNQNHQTIAEVTYCIFDIETTGFNKKFDDIIEIACHKYHNYKLIDQFHCLIYTPILLSPRIRQLTKLTNQKLNQAGIPITTALKQFVAFIKNTVLVAHNGINFDLPFINNKLVANGLLPINNCLVDTMKLSKTLFSQERNHNLKALCNHLGLYYDENQAHQANQDVIYTSAAFFKLLQQFPDLQLPNINHER